MEVKRLKKVFPTTEFIQSPAPKEHVTKPWGKFHVFGVFIVLAMFTIV